MLVTAVKKKIINEKLSKPSKKKILFVPPSYVGSHIANVEHEKIINFIQKNFNHNNFDTEMLHIISHLFFCSSFLFSRAYIYLVKMEIFRGRKGYDYDDDDNDGKSHWSDVKNFFFVRNLELGWCSMKEHAC